jgi:Spy/CpxP family protein refolding chaperone
MRHWEKNREEEVNMVEKMFKIFFVVLLVAGFSTVSLAEPQEDIEKQPSKEQMEKVRKRIETLKMWRLSDALDLDEKTSTSLFPLLSKYDRKRAEIEQSLRGSMKDLRESLREKREGNLKNILDKLEENHKALQRIKEEEWSEIKKILTLEQQARFVIFQQEFEREIRKIIAEAREKRLERFRKEKTERPLPQERPLPPER